MSIERSALRGDGGGAAPSSSTSTAQSQHSPPVRGTGEPSFHTMPLPPCEEGQSPALGQAWVCSGQGWWPRWTVLKPGYVCSFAASHREQAAPLCSPCPQANAAESSSPEGSSLGRARGWAVPGHGVGPGAGMLLRMVFVNRGD